ETVGGEGTKRLPDPLRRLRPIDRLLIEPALEEPLRRQPIAADELSPLGRTAVRRRTRRWATHDPSPALSVDQEAGPAQLGRDGGEGDAGMPVPEARDERLHGLHPVEVGRG